MRPPVHHSVHGPFGPSVGAGRTFRGNTQKIDCRLQVRTGNLSLVLTTSAHTAPPKPAQDQMEEVIAVMNTIVNSGQHNGWVMPVSGRVRVESLRASAPTTTPMSLVAGQKCALMDPTQVIDGYRLVTDVAVTTGAFPGTSAWSPPI